MIDFLIKFKEQVNRVPDNMAIVDRGGQRKTSYRALDEESGRIASWLKKQGIGKEDIVAICVPRGLEFVAVRLAVMKVGAAWVGTEAMMGEERIAYIIKDSNAALVMDEGKYEEALKEEPLEEREWADPDEHDLAFIYYTSGSTGRPKGVLQEYGVYKYIMFSTERAVGRWLPLDYANVAPETFVGGIYLMMGILQAGSTLHLIPLELVRDPAGMLAYFKNEHVTVSCMPPTLVKVLESAGGLDLKVLHITGEIATDIYIDRFPFLNAYGPTEFSYLPFFFDIDRAYSNTPIGTPDKYTEIVLLDDNGEVCSREGTLCIRLPFFRGYLHDEERADFIVIDGKTYFKSSDYMSVDDKGNYTILGRVDDMVKINGNRIEPAEAEFAIKKVLDTDYVAVKAWERNGSRYLCAYHTLDREIGSAEMAEKLKGLLPDYMIPSCYISLKKLPLNENGKVDKTALPAPGDDILFAPYAPPENKEEEELLRQFAEALNIKDRQIGIDDDFFLLGGDSLAAIRLIVNTGDEGLTVPMIYRERTVRNLAGRIGVKTGDGGSGAEDWGTDEIALSRESDLTREQLYFLDQKRKIPDRIIYNMPAFLYFTPETDEEKLKKTVLSVFCSHPALLTVIKETKEGWKQKYCPENNVSLEVEEVSEEDKDGVLRDFIRPFRYDGSPLFRRKLIRSSGALILLLDVDHIICDGTSLRIVIEDILSSYEGKALKRDPYFALLKEQLAYYGSDSHRKDREYFENAYKGEYSYLPHGDLEGKDSEEDTVEALTGFSSSDVSGAAKRLHLSLTAFYMLPSLLALAVYDSSDRVLISWNYHGRSNIRSMRSVGLFIRDYPVGFHFKKEDSIGQISVELARQLKGDILHGNVSPFMDREKEELLCFLYQGNMMEEPESGILEDADIPDVSGMAAIEPMEFKINENGGQIQYEITFDAGLYRRESMERFGEIYGRICRILMEEGCENRLLGDILPEIWNGKD